MNIVFMGTPDYAAKTLEALINTEHKISAVFAQPDKPVGRKQVLTPPPVKVVALENNIPVFQPTTLKNGEALEILKKLNPDGIVVVAYGKYCRKKYFNYLNTDVSMVMLHFYRNTAVLHPYSGVL